ncbi:MAG: hypothetical protein V3T05_06035 [Myxococcota bacterium]
MAATPRKPPPAAGQETDAYCTKCKLILNHVIIAVNGRRIARVQCLTCEGTHAYRASIPGSRARGGGRKSSASPSPEQMYEQLMEGRDVSRARAYKLAEKFDEGEVLNHTKFGLGLVTRVLADLKVEVFFPAGKKILVHGRASV